MAGELVLVTGGSGFVGAHCIVALLNAGYRVRTTVRTLAREDEVRAMVKVGGADPSGVEFAVADLEEDAGWAEAVAGARYVLHVASPFPPAAPDHEDELIIPAREGALRVLRAARGAEVERVVLTSSFAAIGYGHGGGALRASTEADWTDPDAPGVSAYAKSKTLAERAAWEFVRESREAGPELAVVNPVAILGPVLGPDQSTSIQLVQRLLDGAVPGIPHLSYGIVDVRDVADLHLRAMIDPAANGERFLAIGEGFASMADIAKILKANLGDDAARVPTRTLPNWLVRIGARFDPSIRAISSELGKQKAATNAKARTVLGWQPRSNEAAILATARSLIDLGVVKR
ncbi:MAG: aldehyde reductase [Solirubrobacteraceae bacterium]|nr:aldehyde reductase [Solirubrobacteraceae bacterium]